MMHTVPVCTGEAARCGGGHSGGLPRLIPAAAGPKPCRRGGQSCGAEPGGALPGRLPRWPRSCWSPASCVASASAFASTSSPLPSMAPTQHTASLDTFVLHKACIGIVVRVHWTISNKLLDAHYKEEAALLPLPALLCPGGLAECHCSCSEAARPGLEGCLQAPTAPVVLLDLHLRHTRAAEPWSLTPASTVGTCCSYRTDACTCAVQLRYCQSHRAERLQHNLRIYSCQR